MLASVIEKAIDLTGRLNAALKVGNMEFCADLIGIRGEVMADFEKIHRASSPIERKNCQALLANLKSENDQLQNNLGLDMETCASQLSQAITSGSSTPVGAYKSISTPGCLDRKA